MTDYTEAIYRHIRESGDIGDEVGTDIRPWLSSTYGLDRREAVRVRRKAMRDLKDRIERVNVRGPYVRILS